MDWAPWAGPWPAGARPTQGPAIRGALWRLQGGTPRRTHVAWGLPEPESQDPGMVSRPKGTGLSTQLHRRPNRGDKPAPPGP